ncbi:MAG TPA: dockerin type I domain-containing protein [Candidatus Limnocylindrales bacterium]|nr:dockerin type I domain-containing protein [Candidatus Limnocylindrales bacterium]
MPPFTANLALAAGLGALALLFPARAIGASCGDANGTNGTNATDALVVLRKAVGGNQSCPPCACDVNADGGVSATDALAVLRRAVGLTRFLACFAGQECTTPQPLLSELIDDSVDAGALLAIEAGGFDQEKSHVMRVFSGTTLSIEIPTVIAQEGAAAAAMPPLTSALAVKVQVLEGKGSSTRASNVLAGPTIAPLPVPPNPPGQVTRDFLAGAIARSQQLIDEIEMRDDAEFDVAADALADSMAALQTLDSLVQSAAAGGMPSLGFFDGQPFALTQADVVQVDALLLAMLKARAEHVDASPALAARAAGDGARAPLARGAAQSRAHVSTPRAAGDCGQNFADTYYNDLKNGQPTTASRPGYFSAPCAADAFGTGFAVAQGSAALGVGVLAAAGAPAIALSLPAAAIGYVTIVGGNGLIAVGGALGAAAEGSLELVKQGIRTVDLSMRAMLDDIVLPDLDGVIRELAMAVYELAPNITDPPPPPTTTTVTSSSTTTMGSGVGCFCCCAFWDGVENPFYCLESSQPQQPSNGETAVCSEYGPDFCGTGFCEN